MFRKIIHLDMDAFFASVEMRDNPSLRGKPMAVGGDPGTRSVIATANYEARKFGVRSAMPSWKAKQLCPQLIIVHPHFDKYVKESQAIHEIFQLFTETIESMSIDEAYLDVTNSEAFNGSATLMAQEIRRLVWEERNLTVSAGVAPNKFLAKIASDWKKPNGLFVITPDEVEAFMKDLPVKNIPGIGHVTEKRLHSLNVFTCGDLQNLDIYTLHKHFGKRAWNLYELCRGIDHSPVIVDHIHKSISVESTFSKDLDITECEHEISDLYSRLLERYEKIKGFYSIKKPFVKIKFANFLITTVESKLFPSPTLESYQSLIKIGWERKKFPIRLLGLGLTLNYRQQVQLTLF